jgi:hypothetical protein
MKIRRKNLSRLNQYCLDGYLLKVNDLAYLVEVEINRENKADRIRLEDLPHWIFDSRHAIWLTLEDLPIKDRAAHGDRIREKLIESSGFCTMEVLL